LIVGLVLSAIEHVGADALLCPSENGTNNPTQHRKKNLGLVCSHSVTYTVLARTNFVLLFLQDLFGATVFGPFNRRGADLQCLGDDVASQRVH
jgi:hypothetical protein